MLLGTLKKDREIKALLHCADNQLDAMGYTEHSFRHVSIVCQRKNTRRGGLRRKGD